MVNALNSELLRRLTVAFGAFAFVCLAPQAVDAASRSPSLTISGNLNRDAKVELNVTELEALGTVEVHTATPWHDGLTRFEGVPLQSLIEHVGASGSSVMAVALNDYTSSIPISDFSEYGVILALKTNGEYMSVREKGPFFIIYPYDRNPILKSQKFYSRSVWQVKELVIE